MIVEAMPPRNVSASEAVVVLKRQELVRRTTRIATEAKGVLSACRSADVACSAEFPSRGLVRETRALLVVLYICNVSLWNSFDRKR